MTSNQADDNLLHAYETLLKEIPDEEKARKIKAKEFEYIPLNNYTFIQQLDIVEGLLLAANPHNTRKATFIDVGCGIGSKVLLAQQHGFDASGIDNTPQYVAVARKLLSTSTSYPASKGGEIILGNALTYSYDKFDVIYLYCPLIDSELEDKLEQRILSTAKPGAYILVNRSGGKVWGDPKKVKAVWKSTIYQKRK